jgi:hypothetical protein
MSNQITYPTQLPITSRIPIASSFHTLACRYTVAIHIHKHTPKPRLPLPTITIQQVAQSLLSPPFPSSLEPDMNTTRHNPTKNTISLRNLADKTRRPKLRQNRFSWASQRMVGEDVIVKGTGGRESYIKENR